MSLIPGSFAQLRTRFEVVERVGARVFLVLSPAWSDVPTVPRGILLAFGAAADATVLSWLSRLPPERHGWRLRLAHMGLDVAANVALHDPRTTYTAAVMNQAATAVEAGYSREKVAASAMPVVCLAGVTVGRALRRRPPWPVDPVTILPYSSALGWLLRRYEERELRSAKKAHETDLEAAAADARAQAHFVLYSEIGGSRLLDDLKNSLVPLIAANREAVVATQGMMQRRKEEATRPLASAVTVRRALEEATGRRYLEVTNRPSTFRPSVSEPAASTILTARQARQLLDWVQSRFVTGEPGVRLVSGGHRVGSGITLAVGRRRCRLKADQAPIELLPLGWIGGAAMVLMTILPSDVAVPAKVAVTSSGLFCCAAAGSSILLRRFGRLGRSPAAFLGCLPLAFHAARGTATMRCRRSPAGKPRYPVTVPLMPVALVAGHYWEDIRTSHRIAIGILTVSSVAVCWALADRNKRAFLAEAVLPIQCLIMAGAARELLEHEVAEANELEERVVELTAEQSYRNAIRPELVGLENWVRDAEQVLQAAGAADRDLWEEASRRLAAARSLFRRIERVATGGE